MIPKKIPTKDAAEIVFGMMEPPATTTPAGYQPGTRLTMLEVYALARNAGFPPDMARRMLAIAMRESGLNPNAVCKNCVPGVQEYSLGLWQINMNGSLGKARLKQFAIAKAEDLLDPFINARAAFITWAGKERNLQIAWAIDQEGPLQYRSKYLANLNAIDAMNSQRPFELAYDAVRKQYESGQLA